MAARFFLWTIFAGITLAVVAAIIWVAAGDEILRKFAVPSVSFAESPQTPPTFYDRPDAWVARPGAPSQTVRWQPAGVAPVDPGPAAVFYVHPTTYLLADRWNAAADPEDEGALYRRDLFARSQASVFSSSGEIWAPKYRQAAFGAFLEFASPDATKAFALAYTDVSNAFGEFLASIPDDRPIILAGHSQGALHLAALLARRTANTDLKDRLVAAYLLGWPISVTADLPALGIPPCSTPDQTGCLFAFQSFSEPADPSLILDAFDSTLGFTGAPRAETSLVCTNPLTAGARPDAPASENLGSLVPEASLDEGELEPGLVGAACSGRGILSLGDNVPSEFGTYSLPGNNLHVYDYPLFWANLKADAERRTAAFVR